MFKKSYNRAVLRIRVDTVTPLLIRAGDAGLDPTAVDLSCVRTRHAMAGRTVYIPGSSLKGVVRAAAEASIRGRKLDGRVGSCDDPLRGRGCDANGSPQAEPKNNKQGDRNGARTEEQTSTQIYRQHCLSCRVFGSTDMHGRAGVRDLFPWSPYTSAAKESLKNANETEIRYGVSIDRIVGSVKNGPFEQEVVPAGASFWGEVALLNYQTYQLGLLFQAFEELNSGFAQLGSSKSRGLGVATVVVESILHEQSGVHGAPLDVATLADQKEREEYGLLRAAALPISEGKSHGVATRFEVEGKLVNEWREKSLAALSDLIRGAAK